MRWLFLSVAGTAVIGGIVLAVSALTGGDLRHVHSVAVDEDPRVLVVAYLTSPPECGAPARVTVKEDDKTVEVRAWEGDMADGVCPAMEVPRTTRVTLDQELGNREVIDGRGGQTLVVTGRDD
jgi:hypothetical protein